MRGSKLGKYRKVLCECLFIPAKQHGWREEGIEYRSSGSEKLLPSIFELLVNNFFEFFQFILIGNKSEKLNVG